VVVTENRTLTAYEINRYQVALDLPRSDLPELEGVVSDYEFEDQGQNQQTSETSVYESVEYEQLRREEAEAEAEAEQEKWWIYDY